MKKVTGFWSKSRNPSPESTPTGTPLAKSAYTLLMEAVNQGNEEQARALLAQGTSVNMADRDGRTALHQACVQGKLELVNLLLTEGANLLAVNSEGETPFHKAAQYGHVAILKALLANASDRMALLTAKDMDGKTALHKAAFCPNAHTIEYLIEQGTEVDAITQYGYTALHFAARSGHTEVAQKLLNASANPTLTNVDGQTPAMIAKQFNYPVLSQQLEAAAIRYYVLHPLASASSANTLTATLASELTLSLSDNNNNNNNAPLSPQREERHTHIGGRYALINKINLEEANTLYQQSQLKITFLPDQTKARVVIGQGWSGKLRLARHLPTGQFVAVKKVKGEQAIALAEQEAALLAELKGEPNVMQLLDSVKTTDSQGQPVLYHFMVLAGAGNGDDFKQGLQRISNSNDRERLFIHMAKGILTGLHSLHRKHIMHLDMKPSNWVMDQAGTAYVVDLGCSVKTAQAVISGGSGDTRYFSPERLAHMDVLASQQPLAYYDAAKADAWAAGLTLLEMAIGTNPFVDPNTQRLGINSLEHLEAIVSHLPALQNPAISSSWVVIKGLLAIDPEDRLSIEEALSLPVFQRPANALDAVTLKLLITQLQGQPEALVDNQGAQTTAYSAPTIAPSPIITAQSHYGIDTYTLTVEEERPTVSLTKRP